MNDDDRVDTELQSLRSTIMRAAALIGFAIVLATGIFCAAIVQSFLLISDRLPNWGTVEPACCEPANCWPIATPTITPIEGE